MPASFRQTLSVQAALAAGRFCTAAAWQPLVRLGHSRLNRQLTSVNDERHSESEPLILDMLSPNQLGLSHGLICGCLQNTLSILEVSLRVVEGQPRCPPLELQREHLSLHAWSRHALDRALDRGHACLGAFAHRTLCASFVLRLRW